MFVIKKIVAPLLLPFSIVTALLLAGLALLWYTKKVKTARALLTAAGVLLLLFSYSLVPDLCLGLLEKRYTPLLSPDQANNVSWVVVLGARHTSDPNLPATSQASQATLSRLIEGVRIHRMAPGSKLVLSGGIAFDPKSEAETMAVIALALGVDRNNLVLDTGSKDTKDQAVSIKKLVGNDRFALVTSAAHMPRAMALFRKQGLAPLPAPTDFWVKQSQGFNPRDLFPDASNFGKMERATHEFLGIAWAKLRGQI